MSAAASQAAAFYREVAASGFVWAIRDAGGFPAPVGTGDQRAMPFWSSEARAKRVIDTVPAYAGFEPVQLEWRAFADRWVPGLTRDQLLVGVNWSGSAATGYDLRPDEVLRNVKALRPK